MHNVTKLLKSFELSIHCYFFIKFLAKLPFGYVSIYGNAVVRFVWSNFSTITKWSLITPFVHFYCPLRFVLTYAISFRWFIEPYSGQVIRIWNTVTAIIIYGYGNETTHSTGPTENNYTMLPKYFKHICLANEDIQQSSTRKIQIFSILK